MPNLSSWIEAQLKRGYSKTQVKSHLARKGYPHKVVAEVDKVKYSLSPTKTLPSKKIPKKFSSKNFLLLGLVIVSLIWLISTFSGQQKTSENDIPLEPIPIAVSEEIPEPDTFNGILQEVCFQDIKLENIVSCEEAVMFVVENSNVTLKTISEINFDERENTDTGQVELVWEIIVETMDGSFESEDSDSTPIVIYDKTIFEVDATKLRLLQRIDPE